MSTVGGPRFQRRAQHSLASSPIAEGARSPTKRSHRVPQLAEASHPPVSIISESGRPSPAPVDLSGHAPLPEIATPSGQQAEARQSPQSVLTQTLPATPPSFVDYAGDDSVLHSSDRLSKVAAKAGMLDALEQAFEGAGSSRAGGTAHAFHSIVLQVEVKMRHAVAFEATRPRTPAPGGVVEPGGGAAVPPSDIVTAVACECFDQLCEVGPYAGTFAALRDVLFAAIYGTEGGASASSNESRSQTVPLQPPHQVPGTWGARMFGDERDGEAQDARQQQEEVGVGIRVQHGQQRGRGLRAHFSRLTYFERVASLQAERAALNGKLGARKRRAAVEQLLEQLPAPELNAIVGGLVSRGIVDEQGRDTLHGALLGHSAERKTRAAASLSALDEPQVLSLIEETVDAMPHSDQPRVEGMVAGGSDGKVENSEGTSSSRSGCTSRCAVAVAAYRGLNRAARRGLLLDLACMAPSDHDKDDSAEGEDVGGLLAAVAAANGHSSQRLVSKWLAEVGTAERSAVIQDLVQHVTETEQSALSLALLDALPRANRPQVLQLGLEHVGLWACVDPVVHVLRTMSSGQLRGLMGAFFSDCGVSHFEAVQSTMMSAMSGTAQGTFLSALFRSIPMDAKMAYITTVVKTLGVEQKIELTRLLNEELKRETAAALQGSKFEDSTSILIGLFGGLTSAQKLQVFQKILNETSTIKERLRLLGLGLFFTECLGGLLSEVAESDARVASYWATPERERVLASVLADLPLSQAEGVIDHFLNKGSLRKPDRAALVHKVAQDLMRLPTPEMDGGTTQVRSMELALQRLSAQHTKLAHMFCDVALHQLGDAQYIIEQTRRADPQSLEVLGIETVSQFEAQLRTKAEEAATKQAEAARLKGGARKQARRGTRSKARRSPGTPNAGSVAVQVGDDDASAETKGSFEDVLGFEPEAVQEDVTPGGTKAADDGTAAVALASEVFPPSEALLVAWL